MRNEGKNKAPSFIGDEEYFKLSEDEKEIIKVLREEAYHVKDCFTKFSFQAIIFATIAIGILAKAGPDIYTISLACISVIFILLTVARIGTHKYATANRIYGYELHLYRCKYSLVDPNKGWQPYMRRIGWEEAMRAWRVVQATVFEHLYFKGKLWPNYLRYRVKKEKKELKWFLPKELVETGATYHSGSYIKIMFGVLYLLAFLSTLPILFYIIQKSDFEPKLEVLMNKTNLLPEILFVLLLAWVLKGIIKTNARRKMLESGLLSIHSCAIMWQAVVLAHYRALKKSKLEPEGVYTNYTKHLSEEAKHLKQNILKIHQWNNDPDSLPREAKKPGR
jgi:hypothetical protein